VTGPGASIARVARRARPGAELEGAAAAKRRVQASLIVLIVLLAALLAAGLYGIFGLYNSAESRYIHLLFPLRTATRDVVLQTFKEQSSVRGYMITRDRSSLRPYFDGRAQGTADIAEIRRLTRGQALLQARLLALEQEIRGLHGYADRQITFVADGTLGQRRARADVLGGDKLFARFRRTAAAMEGDIAHFVDQTRASQRRTFHRAVGLLVASGAFALLIAMLLAQRVPERLRELYAAEEQARIRAERGANAARALAHVSDAVVLVDDAGTVRSWNAAGEQLFGVSAEAALGRAVRDVIPRIDDLVAQSAAGGDLAAVQVDGEEHWLAVVVSEFDGGYVLTIRDATAEHLLERARADFVTTASHELRTPLTGIYGGVRTLLDRGDSLDEGARLGLLQMIDHESQHLSQIVDQLLVTAQIDRGRLQLSEAECDVEALCASVLASAEARRPAEVTLTLVAETADTAAYCDELRLKQVIVNLVENAIKYSPGGGNVDVRISDDEDRVRIDVRDEGLGIPPSEQPRIFEKFYRLDAEMTRGVGGSGLGLYISREIVEQMGGSLSVHSTLGEGSTFTVTLPRPGSASRLVKLVEATGDRRSQA
jgi:two-component system phosphate regulon sensor histidine kinase PhoR